MTNQPSLGARWDAYLRRPFPLLVRLSMDRIFHGSNAGEEELSVSMGVLLSLLAVPGGFVSLFLFDKYGSFLQWLRGQKTFDTLAAALPDEYFFIVLSMVVTGGVAVWWWDSIFPDRRDFANLVPLPVSTYRIFLANAAAIALLTCLLAADVNLASSILFPGIVSASQPSVGFLVRFGVVHSLVVVLASIFSFLSIFALAGLLMLLLPYAMFRRVSLYFRALLITLLLAILSTSFAVPETLKHLSDGKHSAIRFLPPVWFLGICQTLRGRADAALVEFGQVAIFALAAAFVLAVATYILCYRRCFMRIPELADIPQGRLGAHSSWFFRILDFLMLHTRFQRAGYRFVIKTLFRNETHSLALGGFAGLGLVLASRTLFSAIGQANNPFPSPPALSIPLVLGYFLLVGIRFGFDVPAQIQSNWTFRFLLANDARDCRALVRRLMVASVSLLILPAALPIYLHFWGWKIALLHTGVVVLWIVLLTEVLVTGFRKLPFTCSYPPFHHSAVVVVIAFVFGYYAFAVMTSELEGEAFENPARGIVRLLICLAVWYGIYRFRKTVIDGREHLIFEDVPDAPFERLCLTEGSR